MLYFNKNRKYLDTRTLKVYENILDTANFCRIHKSHIINISYLKEYLSEDGQYAVMNDGIKLPIARGRIEDFKNQVIGK